MTRARDAADQINRVNSSAADATAITVDASENVGIGTSSPSFKMSLNGGMRIENLSSSPSSGSGIEYGYNASSNEGFQITRTKGVGTSTYRPFIHRSEDIRFDTGTSSTSERMRIDSSGNVGIGRTPSVVESAYDSVQLGAGGTWLSGSSNLAAGHFGQNYYVDSAGASRYLGNDEAERITMNNGYISFETAPTNSGGAGAALTWSESMRIDASGNLLVGNTSTGLTSDGINLHGNGILEVRRNLSTANNSTVAYISRGSSDGNILQFYKDTTHVGSIGTAATVAYIMLYPSTGFRGGSSSIIPATTGGAPSDNSKDLGASSYRWDDIFATNGTIQTSDRNEKQDIEALNDAETAVAVACKGLLRKFRWIDAVAEKGDDARIHFGIIAQDLQDAFAAEGLDAGRYAMFISSTWWETQTDVPAVEAVDEVLDEDGNVVTEAVEAKDAYTRTDTYETLEEAPEGATERTRLGVRYPELLAFIIGAM